MIPDTVFEREGSWYFWDETWANRIWPFDTEKEARINFTKFCKELSYSKKSNPGMSGQYTFRGGVEPIGYIRSNNMTFLEGNIIKYIYRYPIKNKLEDLLKARAYLDWLIKDFQSTTVHKPTESIPVDSGDTEVCYIKEE